MKNKLILLRSERFGDGDEQLGAIVMESFWTVVKSRDALPAVVFCVNRGVFALTNRSLANVHLAELERAGVRVLACKTCVDFYDVEDALQAGVVSSMGEFVDLAAQHEVVTIG